VQQYTFDFFNYAGIHRSVHLYTTPVIHISEVIVSTDLSGTDGKTMPHKKGLSSDFFYSFSQEK
jgi:beta-galactosidase/beta-glucuronidase